MAIAFVYGGVGAALLIGGVLGDGHIAGWYSLRNQVIQILGALLVLSGFVLAQTGRLRPESRLYLWMNLVGSAALTVLALIRKDLGFLLLEGVWALVSAWSLVQVARGRPVAQAPTH